MMGFKEFLLSREAGEKTCLEEAVMGGSPIFQLSTMRVAFKQNDDHLRRAWAELGAPTNDDDLGRLKSTMRALVASDRHKSRELHLVLELLVLAHEGDQQKSRRR